MAARITLLDSSRQIDKSYFIQWLESVFLDKYRGFLLRKNGYESIAFLAVSQPTGRSSGRATPSANPSDHKFC
jgi:hypothetical protein